MLKNPWLSFALIGGALTSLAMAVHMVYAGAGAQDLMILWESARTPLGQIYEPDPFGPFVYPPTAIPWLRPLALLPLWPAFAIWTALSLSVFFWATRASALLLLSPAVVSCVTLGQTPLLVSSLLFIAKRGWLMGAMFGLAFTIKPHLVFLAPAVFLVRRDWQALGGFLAAVAAAVCATTLALGFQPWLDWLASIPAFRQTLVDRDLFWVMISIAGTAERFGLPALPFWLAGTALAAITVFNVRQVDASPVILVASLLAAPYSVTHDLVALLPFALLALREGGRAKPFHALIFAAAFVPVALIGIAVAWLHESNAAKKSALTA